MVPLKSGCWGARPVNNESNPSSKHLLSCPRFFWGGSRGQQPWEDPKYLTANRISDIPAGSEPRRGQTWSEMQSLHLALGWPLGRFPVDMANRTSSIFRGALWTRAWTNVAGISRFGGEVAQHSGLHEVHNCALCREVSHRGLFAKIPSLSLVFEIAHFRSLPKTHDHRWGSEQRSV